MIFTNEEKNHFLEYKLHQAKLLKIPDSLGVLDEIAKKVYVLKYRKNMINARSILFIADNGVAQENVSAISLKTEHKVFKEIGLGKAPINIISEENKAPLKVYDVGSSLPSDPSSICDLRVAHSTKNIFLSNAMSERQFYRCFESGKKVARSYKKDNALNIFILGEMGIGNTTVISIINSLILGLPIDEIYDIGSGSDSTEMNKKKEIIDKCIKKFENIYGKFSKKNLVELLCMFGSFELVADVGFLIEAVGQNDLIIVDGAITMTAVLIASFFLSNIDNNIIFSHLSSEKCAKKILDFFNREAALNLGMRMGQATGAGLFYSILRPVLRIHFESSLS